MDALEQQPAHGQGAETTHADRQHNQRDRLEGVKRDPHQHDDAKDRPEPDDRHFRPRLLAGGGRVQNHARGHNLSLRHSLASGLPRLLQQGHDRLLRRYWKRRDAQRKWHDRVLTLAVTNNEPAITRPHPRLLDAGLYPTTKQTERIIAQGARLKSSERAV